MEFTDLSIDTSALYVLASPSTPDLVRQEALKRAEQGEAISHAKVKAITKQHQETTKSMTSIYDASDITTKSIMRKTFNPSQPLQTSLIVDTQSDSII